MKVQKPLHARLEEKGWSQEEIDNAMHIIHHPDKQEKHIQFSKDMNWIIYWTVILVLTICNFLISLVLIPFLLILKPTLIEIIVVVLGFVFGLFFNHLIWEIEHVEKKHHYVAALLIPVIAIANIFFMVTVADGLAIQAKELIGIEGIHENPFLVSILYVGAFTLPYIFTLIRYQLGKHKHSHNITEDYEPKKEE